MAEKFKVFAADGFSKQGVDYLENTGKFAVTVSAKTTHDELLAAIPEYDALIVRSASTVSKDVFEAGKNLKIVARAGVGIDNVDVAAATAKGVLAMNAPGGNTISTAELTFGMLLALARHIPQANASMKTQTWDKKSYSGNELAGKTLGVIGFGRIGRAVALRALAFEMKVLATDPIIDPIEIEEYGVTATERVDIYKQADFITVHTPLTPETENLITLKEMKTMKPTAKVINCARGGIINEKDLQTALKEHIIAGAAIDVYTDEPPKEYLYTAFPNCITTPHLGASTAEAQVKVAVEAAHGIAAYLLEGKTMNAMNAKELGK